MNTSNYHTLFCSASLFIFVFATAVSCFSQAAQDSTLNNLVHPAGYKTCNVGELGDVQKSGVGKKCIIVIPGLGFGSNEYQGLIKRYGNEYTIYAITPAGFAGTSAPPMPDTSTKYSTLTWTNGIVTGILHLIDKERIDRPILVAHFVTGTQVALRIALQHPEIISKAIIVGGSPYRYYPTRTTDGTMDWKNELTLNAQQRESISDQWASKWFKTVTKQTWDKNMWMPEDYCKDSTLGKQLFKTSAEVPLQVMVRYLIEWGAYDPSEEYKKLAVPTLILIPDFMGLLLSPDSAMKGEPSPQSKEYLKYYHQQTWHMARKSGNTFINIEMIDDTRLFMWDDNPAGVFRAIDNFLVQ